MNILKSIRNLLKKLSSNTAGATAVEFALAGPAFITLLYGIMETGHYYVMQQSLDYAVEEGARYAALNTDATAQDVIDYTKGLMNDTINTDAVVVSVTDTLDDNTSLYFKDVEAAIPFNMFVYETDTFAEISISAHSKYLELSLTN